MKESHLRSLVKSITWRIIGSTITMAVVYIMTKDLAIMASIGVVDIMAQIFFYYLHERTWSKIHWGVHGLNKSKR